MRKLLCTGTLLAVLLVNMLTKRNIVIDLFLRIKKGVPKASPWELLLYNFYNLSPGSNG